MKKLMIAAAIVCAAAMVNAAQISWGSNTSKFVDGTGTPDKTGMGGQIVLITLADTTGWSAGTWTAAAGSVTERSIGTISSMSTATGTVSKNYTWTYGTAGSPADGEVLAVVFKDKDGAYSQLSYCDSKAPVADTFTISGLSDDLYSKSFTFAQGGNFTVASVPEPTSAMLLVLGLGALALRRRRA